MEDPKPGTIQASEQVASATISAVVIRADGTREDLGVIATTETDD